jgi:hypothetical protein
MIFFSKSWRSSLCIFIVTSNYLDSEILYSEVIALSSTSCIFIAKIELSTREKRLLPLIAEVLIIIAGMKKNG